MANLISKGTIGILTGGGDVPGLNPAIRAVTVRALREGYKVIGLRRGWAGIIDVIRDPKANNDENYIELSRNVVDRASRTGGTFLHSSRTRPSHVAKSRVPHHLKDQYKDEVNDLTKEVIGCIDDGLCAAIVQQNPKQEGIEAVNELKSLIGGGTAKAFIDVPIAIVTKANVDPYRVVFP